MKCFRTTDARVFTFFRDILGLHGSADFRGCLYIPNQFLGMVAKPEHVAVAVGFNGFIGKTCAMHVVVQRPEYLSRQIIRESFEYPFIKAGIEAVIGLVDSKNQAAMDFDRRVGFEEIHRIPNGALEGDLVMFQMLKADCRWIGRNHG